MRFKAYTANPATALVKSAKLFWSDSGLATWLAGIHELSALEKRADLGFWLEQAVFQTLQAWRGNDPFRRRLSYWRTRGGDEVDFVLEEDQRCVTIEVKAGGRIGMGDVGGLRRFAQEHRGATRLVRGVALYGGREVRFPCEGVVALPHAALFPPPALD